MDPTQKLFSSLNLSNTSCLSDELVYPRGGYLANRQMAESVKLVGVLLVIQDAHSQPGEPEARSQKPVDSEAIASHLGIVPRILQVPN